jgi:hypothetical protein
VTAIPLSLRRQRARETRDRASTNWAQLLGAAKAGTARTVVAFMSANDASPVTEHRMMGSAGWFTLADGSTHRLDAAALAALPRRYPKWEFRP